MNFSLWNVAFYAKSPSLKERPFFYYKEYCAENLNSL